MVTTKLTLVVRIIYNSTRPPPSPANSVSVCHSQQLHSSVQRPPSRLQFLIANLELEFRVSAIRINELKFSNRKFLAILRPSFWILSSFELQVPSFQNLIENTPLRFRLTHTRISLLEISNRERMAVSLVARGQTSLRAALLSSTNHGHQLRVTLPISAFTRHSSPVTYHSRNTLTCRALTA
jgi:hypothetical protein